jgi:hypothetical protein
MPRVQYPAVFGREQRQRLAGMEQQPVDRPMFSDFPFRERPDRKIPTPSRNPADAFSPGFLHRMP